MLLSIALNIYPDCIPLWILLPALQATTLSHLDHCHAFSNGNLSPLQPNLNPIPSISPLCSKYTKVFPFYSEFIPYKSYSHLVHFLHRNFLAVSQACQAAAMTLFPYIWWKVTTLPSVNLFSNTNCSVLLWPPSAWKVSSSSVFIPEPQSPILYFLKIFTLHLSPSNEKLYNLPICLMFFSLLSLGYEI